jgi:hypothetical protein
MEKSQKKKTFKQLFQMMILGMIGAQFYISFEFNHESKMVLSTPQGGSTLIKQQDTLQHLQGGSILMKMVSGQPKPPQNG